MRKLDEGQIRRIVQRVLDEIENTSAVVPGKIEQEKPPAVVFFCGCPGGLDELSFDLSAFRKRFFLVAGCSPAAESLLGRDYLEREAGALISEKTLYEAVHQAEVVLFPNLSQNTAAKAASGIRDTPGSEVMSLALREGKRVIACRSWICPGSKKDPYSMLLSGILGNIEKIGVQLYSRGSLVSHFERDREQNEEKNKDGTSFSLVTAAAVREAKAKGLSMIQTDGRCIVTPLARDEAKKLNVELLI